jgi:hypothetical protein
MASTLPKRQLRYAGTISGNQPLVRAIMPATGATIHAGDVVVSSAGLAAVSATPVPAANTVLGLSMHGVLQGTSWYLVPEDLSGGQVLQQEDTGGTFGGTFMGMSSLLGSPEGLADHIIVANQDTLFWIVLVQAIALSQLGVSVGITQDATTKVWQADTTQATKSATIVAIPNYSGQLEIIGGVATPYNPIPTLGVTGDLNYPVVVRFLPAATALA